MAVFVACVLSFLIGGIPFGFLVGRYVLKDDIRRHGSGNIGATNVARVIGWKWGGLVLFLDALKGAIPAAIAAWYAMAFEPSLRNHLPVAAGMAAIIGHMYPIYLRLRGGKGVATALGVVVVVAPGAVGIALAVFILMAGITRIVALASMLAALAFGISQFLLLGAAWSESDNLSLSSFAAAIPVLIIWRHRSNIVRMVKGTELQVTQSTAPEADAPSATGQPVAGEQSAIPEPDSSS